MPQYYHPQGKKEVIIAKYNNSRVCKGEQGERFCCLKVPRETNDFFIVAIDVI